MIRRPPGVNRSDPLLPDTPLVRAPATVDAVGGGGPPKGIEVINPFELPLLNTISLLTSGTTVTWAHHALIHGQRGGDKTGLWGLLGVGNRDGVLKGLWLTIVLGVLFSAIQAYEYAHAPFAFKGLKDRKSTRLNSSH